MSIEETPEELVGQGVLKPYLNEDSGSDGPGFDGSKDKT